MTIKLAEVDDSSDAQYSYTRLMTVWTIPLKEKVSWMPLNESEIRDCLSASVIEKSVRDSSWRWSTFNVNPPHRAIIYFLHFWFLRLLLRWSVEFRTVTLSSCARILFYFLCLRTWKQTMELAQVLTSDVIRQLSDVIRQLPDKVSREPPEHTSLQKNSCKVLWETCWEYWYGIS